MSDIDIARKGLEVAIHLHVEACNRKAVREFAERLKSDAESGTGDIEKLLDDCVSLSNSNATFLYLNYIDKVLAEYEKEKTHEQNK